jgi:hypothetical protein
MEFPLFRGPPHVLSFFAHILHTKFSHPAMLLAQCTSMPGIFLCKMPGACSYCGCAAGAGAGRAAAAAFLGSGSSTQSVNQPSFAFTVTLPPYFSAE